MSSQKRIDSSRANGAKSHGPVTPEGRARSRAAGLTHGLTSDQLLLEGESEEQFNALREEYLAEYQPQTRSRFDLVDQLVAARWRHNRVLALQTALMDHQITRQEPEIREEYDVCDGETRAAIAYQHLCDDSRGLESLHRHEARLSAELRRTLKLLDAQLKNQKFHYEPSPADPQSNEEDPDPETLPIPPTGSTGDSQQATSDQPLARQPDDLTEPRSSGSGAEAALPDREVPQIPPAASTCDGQQATSGPPRAAAREDPMSSGHPAPATNQDDPDREAPRIPPPASTGDERPATSGPPRAAAREDPMSSEHPAPATNQDDPDHEAPRIPPTASTGGERPAASGASGAPLMRHGTNQAKIRDRVEKSR